MVQEKDEFEIELENKFMRKGAGQSKQFASVNKSLCASLSLSCNDPPEWFSDDAFLERCYQCRFYEDTWNYESKNHTRKACNCNPNEPESVKPFHSCTYGIPRGSK